MKEFKNNEYVWWNNEGWLYLGMDEDGITHLYRPLEGHPFYVIQFEQLGVDDLEDFIVIMGEEIFIVIMGEVQNER